MLAVRGLATTVMDDAMLANPGRRLSWIAQSEGFDYDVLVIGSGFGGSVSALRLTEKGYRVGVLEAGRRFADDEFACGRSRTSSIICPSRSSTPARIRSWTRRDQRIRVLLEHLGRSTLAPTRVAGRGVPASEPDDRPGYGFVPMAFSAEETAQFMARRIKPATVKRHGARGPRAGGSRLERERRGASQWPHLRPHAGQHASRRVVV
jgi:choline dehydrogenase-like flavoprotein